MEHEKLRIMNEQHEAIELPPVQMSMPKVFGFLAFKKGI